MKGKTSSGKTSQNREELEPTLSPAPESFRGYVILIHPRVHGDAVLRDSAPLSLLRRPTCSLERSRWAPGPLEHPLPAHLFAFPLCQGQGQGRVGETSPTPRGQFSAKTAASSDFNRQKKFCTIISLTAMVISWNLIFTWAVKKTACFLHQFFFFFPSSVCVVSMCVHRSI